MTRIVLTVAHLDPDEPLDCPIEKLGALCQNCHLSLDAGMHAAVTRRLKKEAVGQLPLFEGLMKESCEGSMPGRPLCDPGGQTRYEAGREEVELYLPHLPSGGVLCVGRMQASAETAQTGARALSIAPAKAAERMTMIAIGTDYRE